MEGTACPKRFPYYALGERPLHENFKVTFKDVYEGRVASAHAIDADHRYPQISIIPRRSSHGHGED
jgi:hypothetical protein